MTFVLSFPFMREMKPVFLLPTWFTTILLLGPKLANELSLNLILMKLRDPVKMEASFLNCVPFLTTFALSSPSSKTVTLPLTITASAIFSDDQTWYELKR